MQRMRESVKPVLCSRTLKVSTALATMQVSIWRRASNSPSVSKGATAMYAPFKTPVSQKRKKSML